jgi:hypothetical protein
MDCVPGHPTFIKWCEHGRLIVASPPGVEHDGLEAHLISQQSSLNFRHLYSMSTYLEQRRVSLNHAAGMKLPRYHLIQTSLPNIFNVINGLYRSLASPDAKASIDNIEPDQQLNLSAPQVRIGTNFSLTTAKSSHGSYKSYLNAATPTTKNVHGKSVGIDGRGIQIAVIDTGLETGKPAPASYIDFVIPNTPQYDADGHGTAMVEIIKDVAPGVGIHVYRVTHSTTVFIWDLMAAVLAAVYHGKVDIVSLSMGCKNLSYPCKICGGHGQNRSAVCQQLFDLIDKNTNSIVVASVGNDGQQDPFEWPAAYDSVLAVGSINAANAVSSFSNSATQKPAIGFCLLPGGDEIGGSIECVGEGQDGNNTTYCLGTSPATAYAAGILALRRHRDREQGLVQTKAQFLNQLSTTAQKKVMDASGANIYSSVKHGMGCLEYTP